MKRDPHCRGTNQPDEKLVSRKVKFFGCPQWMKAKNVCIEGTGDYPARLLIVAEAPTPEEDRTGYALMGAPGTLLKSIMADKLPGVTWRFTHATRCCPGKTPSNTTCKPRAAAMRACLPYLRNEVERTQPDVIVALGAHAAAMVLGQPVPKCKLQNRHGRLWSSRFLFPAGQPIPCFVTYKPQWALRDMEANLAMYVRDWEALQRYLATGETAQPLPGQWRVLITPSDISKFYQKLISDLHGERRRRVTIDYETSGLNWYQGEHFTQIGYGLSPDEAVVVDVREDYKNVMTNHRHVLALARDVDFHNFPFDGTFGLGLLGVLPGGRVWDTKALAYLSNENTMMSLEAQVDLRLPEFSGFKYESNDYGGPWDEMPIEVLARRCAYDCMSTWRLRDILWNDLAPESKALYLEIIEPMLKVLCKTRVRGWRLDMNVLKGLRTFSRDAALVHKQAIEQMIGGSINLNSPVQVATALMHRGIRDSERQAHHPELISTAKGVLERHRGEDPVIDRMLGYSKQIGHVERAEHYRLYSCKMDDGYYLFPGYNWGGKARQDAAAATVTGRLSSAKPNVMNPPPLYRRCFISRFPGGSIIQGDYSQLELRLVAAVAGEEAMLAEFTKPDGDPHGAAARDVEALVGVEVDRQVGKRINFASVYGAGPDTVYDQIQQDALRWSGSGLDKLTKAQVRKMVAAWWESHPAVRTYMNNLHLEAISMGMVKGLFGQHRRITKAKSESAKERSHALRQLGNFPIQNGGAILTLRAMVEVERALTRGGFKALLIGQMHDSIIIDAPANEVERVRSLLVRVMRDESNEWVKSHVPGLVLDVDVKVGYDMRASKAKLGG